MLGRIFLAATVLSLALTQEADARLGDDLLLFDGAPSQEKSQTDMPRYKSLELVSCLNKNTLTYTFATFFSQTKTNPHQFPDQTVEGDYMFLDMSHPDMAEASRESLISACAANPDLDLSDYAIQTDYSGISGPIHKSGAGRMPTPGGEND